jgi:tRNA U34 2-thiouridine synthase MnmA/TrmU
MANPKLKKKSNSKVKALILLSGGLDSTLALHLIREQVIELVALNFTSPFCMCNKKGGCAHSVLAVAGQLSVNLVSIDNTAEMLECVKQPKHGYGANMNPCLDCRIIMFKKARRFMEECGASFIITGEVLSQRPMSQKRHQFKLIERESGLEGLVLRPLSAGRLEETVAEKMGWVDRNRLLRIAGRGRKEQFALAGQFGIQDYPCPAGGCLLTDPNFCRRLKDLMTYKPDFNLSDIQLLKLGRHFRISPACKLIVGRNEGENNTLIGLGMNTDLIFMPSEGMAGPTALGSGNFSQEDKQTAAAIVKRYCDRREEPVIIYLQDKASKVKLGFQTPCISEEGLEKIKI